MAKPSPTMKTLNTLIKLTQKKLEDRQKKIVGIDSELAALNAIEKDLETQVEKGYTSANKINAPAAYQDAGIFGKRVAGEKIEIAEHRKKLNEAKEILLKEMRQFFTEKKRYEILLEEKQTRAKAQKSKKDQANLEELTRNTSI